MRYSVFGLFALCAVPALAQQDSFHLMQIEQALGGVGGNTSMQAIQLRQRALGRTSSVSRGCGRTTRPA